MHTIKIGILVGSLRRDSYSRKIAEHFASFMPEHYEMKMIEIGDLKIFNQDYDDDGTTPDEWIRFRKEVDGMDGFLFVTPEYNRSLPPVLKNALDIASRPYGQNVWSGKPGAVISVSPGKIGGFGANHHLRQVLSFLNVYVMQQPELYIGEAAEVLGEQDQLQERTKKFLQSAAAAFAGWVETFVK